MKLWSKKNIRKWLRFIHRDLGYFFVGITIIYAISGIILNHKKNGEDPAYKTEYLSYQLASGLKPNQVTDYWKHHISDYALNRIIPAGETYQIYLKGGLGTYNPISGELSFEVYEKKQWVYFMNKLHYNSKKGWTLMADIFAIAMLLFALSGMFIVPGKKGIRGRGKWLIAIGIIIPFFFFL